MFKHCHINSDSFAYGTRKMVSSAMYLLAVFLVIFSAAAEVPRLRDLAVKRGIFVGSAAGARWISRQVQHHTQGTVQSSYARERLKMVQENMSL